MADKRGRKPASTATVETVLDVANITAKENEDVLGAVTVTETATEPVATVEETAEAVEAAVAETEDMESVLSDIKAISGNTDTSEKVLVKTTKFNLMDKIPCKSLFHGKLVYTSPLNGSRWVWNEYGSVQHVPLNELETMNNHKPDILNKPLLLILEPTIAEDFNFSDVYRKVASFNKLDSILAKGKVDLIRAKVRELIEVGMRDSVIADMRKRRKENTLVDINVINMLKAELKCDIE